MGGSGRKHSIALHKAKSRRDLNRLGFIGVNDVGDGVRPYRGIIKYQGRIYRGPHRASPREAARDRDRIARHLYHEHAILNFRPAR